MMRRSPVPPLHALTLVALCASNAPSVTAGEGSAPSASVDDRRDFEASIYVGLAIDTFAAGEVNHYLNQDASGGLEERGIAGVDFAFRARRTENGNNQLWIYGQTVHGVRSTDIDCAANPTFPTCQPFQAQIDPNGEFLYLLRNATSLEAFAGLRWELFPIMADSPDRAHFYLKGQVGFLTVSGGSDDVVNVDLMAVGLVCVRGDFVDSYLEVGYGRTELFVTHPNSRWKVDGLLSVPWKLLGSRGRVFMQLTVDSDFGPGSDSIQTYLGFDFALTKHD